MLMMLKIVTARALSPSLAFTSSDSRCYILKERNIKNYNIHYKPKSCPFHHYCGKILLWLKPREMSMLNLAHL